MVDLYRRLIYRRHLKFWDQDREADRELIFDVLTTLVERLLNEGVR